jgi:hypothetical protein
MRTLATIILTAAVLVAAPARAATISYFKTPSRNIVCAHIPGARDLEPVLVCATESGLKPPPPETTCAFGGYTDRIVSVTPSGPAGTTNCAGDPGPLVAKRQARVLAYDTTFRRGALRYRSKFGGLTCRNRRGYGFFLSRARSRLLNPPGGPRLKAAYTASAFRCPVTATQATGMTGSLVERGQTPGTPDVCSFHDADATVSASFSRLPGADLAGARQAAVDAGPSTGCQIGDYAPLGNGAFTVACPDRPLRGTVARLTPRVARRRSSRTR